MRRKVFLWKKFSKTTINDYIWNIKVFYNYLYENKNNFTKRFLMNGGDIYTLSRILGHSSVKVTEQAYLDLDKNDLRVNYQRYSPLANLKRR